MKLSIVIVNYNVEHFLEQCLLSVHTAIEGMDAEVFVVDNKSVDGSCSMVKRKFPWVILVENEENVGFSRGNNQAMRIAKGEYVLLLNPDTVVQNDTFKLSVKFMDENPDSGGLGVKMVDGKGNFLPESKRGLPTPWVAFYKIFGISSVFPRSKKFNKYYLGYLSDDETAEIEILSGAYMLMRKECLDKIGLLDESFFMYGEDIDLSWRIIQGGYKNYYFPHTRIIHYKGESTKKGSLNYVFVFYQAMIIFAKKHFSEQNAKLYSFFINLAIYFRAGIALLTRFIKRTLLPAIDVGVIFGSLVLAKDLYESTQNKMYDDSLVNVAFLVYALTWVISVFYSGGYDKPHKIYRLVRGTVIGSALILIAYSLLPETWRFSRALILIGSGMALGYMLLSRLVLHLFRIPSMSLTGKGTKRFALVGTTQEIKRIRDLMLQFNVGTPYSVEVNPQGKGDQGFVAGLDELDDIIRVHKLNEVIFSGKDVQASRIIDIMSTIEDKTVDFKIAPPESLYIIGSNSIDTSGDLFILDTNSVDKPENRRTKRLFDVVASLLILPLSPVLLWLTNGKLKLISNCFLVLFGWRSWVGYVPNKNRKIRLPYLKEGILHPAINFDQTDISENTIQKLNVVYAKDYRFTQDLKLLINAFRFTS